LALHYESQPWNTNYQFDPIAGNPKIRAVLWRNGKIQDLGTLGGTASSAGGTFAGLSCARRVQRPSDLRFSINSLPTESNSCHTAW
jgi:hypothetical protein